MTPGGLPARAAARPGALLALGLTLGLTLSLAAASDARACGPDSACAVMENGTRLGEYLFVPPPDGAPQPAPAIIFLHGWRATAAAMTKNQSLLDAAREAGAALVLPQGEGMTWSYPGSPAHFRDEFRFFEALRQDLIVSRGVDSRRILLSGFSMGASMVWNIACRNGSQYWGAATFAGAYWDPIPERCPDPIATLLHTHGTADGVVPIEGRPIGASFAQSDVGESLARFTEGRAADAEREDRRGFACREWRGEDDSYVPPIRRLYEFCRHDKGHIFRGAWITRAIEKLTALQE